MPIIFYGLVTDFYGPITGVVRVTFCYGHNLGTATGQYGWLRMLFPDFPSGYGQITGKKLCFFPTTVRLVTGTGGYGKLRPKWLFSVIFTARRPQAKSFSKPTRQKKPEAVRDFCVLLPQSCTLTPYWPPAKHHRKQSKQSFALHTEPFLGAQESHFRHPSSPFTSARALAQI